MNRIKNVRNGIMMGMANYLIAIICPFVIRTIMIYQWGNEYLGLNSLFSSILQVLSLSELGFGVAISYLLYEPIASGNKERINVILNFYRFVYRIIGAVIVMASIVLTFFLPNLVNGSWPNDINIYVLFWIYVVNTVLSYFLFAYKRVLLAANQRYDLEMMIAIGISLFKYILQIVILLLADNYYLYVIIIPLSTALDNLVCSFVINKKFPGHRPEGKIEKKEIVQILKNTGGAFCAKIGSTVYLSVDSIVISSFLGLYILGTYNNYYYIISMFITLFSVVHNTIRPVIGNYWITEDKQKNWTMYRMIHIGYMCFVSVISVCCIFLLKKFEVLWGGTTNELNNNIVFLLVMCFYIERLTAIPTVYLEATGTLWQGKFVPLISAIVNLVVNVILVKKIGLAGVIISSIASVVFVSLPGYTRVLSKTIFSENSYIMKTVLFILSQIGKTGIITVVCYWIDKFLFLKLSWGHFFVEGICLVAVSLTLMCLLNLENKEFRHLIVFLVNKLTSKKKEV